MKFFAQDKQTVNHIVRSTYWFLVGFLLSGALIGGAILFYFQFTFNNRVIPGIFIDNLYVGEKTADEVKTIFAAKNERLHESILHFSTDSLEATVSAKTLNLGYDVNLITEQALSLGKTKSLLTDVYIIVSSYINGTFLSATYAFNEEALREELSSISEQIYKEPASAQFQVENGRVTVFSQSENGQELDFEKLNEKVRTSIPDIVKGNIAVTIMTIPVKTSEPETTTEEANNLGIVEIIGQGTSTFSGSIPNRVHNISLASERTKGVIVPPGEEFSFAASIGDISKFTGYKEAFIISGGKTILGDGGGVCQVSTTLFRAILDSGLPITERNPHSYRVGYYEQDSPPGFDATVYVPTVDLKFLNDTDNHILVLSQVEPNSMRLTFTIYGKKDGREVTITDPVITNVIAPPEPLYQDDPTLPQGTVKQIEYAAPGARSVFTRTVTKNGKVIISDTFVSTYRPWQAVYLRGTGT